MPIATRPATALPRVPIPLHFKDSRREGGTAHPGPVRLQSRAEDQRPDPRAVTGPNGPLWSPAPLGAARTLPAAHGGERPPGGGSSRAAPT